MLGPKIKANIIFINEPIAIMIKSFCTFFFIFLSSIMHMIAEIKAQKEATRLIIENINDDKNILIPNDKAIIIDEVKQIFPFFISIPLYYNNKIKTNNLLYQMMFFCYNH